MSLGLSVSRIVSVSVTLAAIASPRRNFGAILLVDGSDVIDTTEGMREYDSIDAVGTDFGTSAGVYKAAKVFFAQVPQPKMCYIGRWAKAASNGRLNGGLIPVAGRDIALFTAVTTGALELEVDAKPISITGVNFNGATNLNGVATLLQTAVAAQASGATVAWEASQNRFVIRSGTTGIGSSVSLAQAPTATGYITFASNPSAAATVTLNGIVWTFVASGATGNQVNIGATLTLTLAALATAVSASANASLTVANYRADATKFYVEYGTPGSGGNAYTLAASVATPSGSTLTGGTGTDISALFGLTAGTGATSIAGIASETPEQATLRLMDRSNDWYGLIFADPTIADDDHVLIAGLVEAAAPSRVYGVTTQSVASINPSISTDVGSRMMALGYNRTIVQYCSDMLATNNGAYAVTSIMGRFATVDFEGVNTTLTLKFKQEPGIVAELLTASQANALKAKRINVFASYQNGTAIVQEGVMSGGWYIDERHGADWMADRLQNDCFNALYTSKKIPQTDKGMHILTSVIEKACEQAVTNGWVAPGVWNGDSFGTLNTGDAMATGYYVYPQPMAKQAPSDRAARHAPDITVALKMAGAIHDVTIGVSVDR